MKKHTPKPGQAGHSSTTLELTVNNHPGVMSHICGLFARRAFNLEAILCLPEDTGATSRMWLLVKEDERLGQVRSQIEKLHDVLEVRSDPGESMFRELSHKVACVPAS